MPIEDRVTLKGMRFHTRVGMLPHERQHPQPLELDLTVWLAPKQLQKAHPPAFLDYRDLYALVAETVGSRHHGLLEELCEAVAAKAAGESGTICTLSTLSGTRLEEVKAASPHDCWFQLYLIGGKDVATKAIQRDRRVW